MISVSETAKAVLLESLQASGVPAEQGLRLKVRNEGWVLETDSPTDQDHVIEHEGSTVVIVDPDVEEGIGQAVIDVAEGSEGPELVVRRTSENGLNP